MAAVIVFSALVAVICTKLVAVAREFFAVVAEQASRATAESGAP